jgi:glucosamine--fructose-6-phosphate aminotransferase (isomerizing)
VARRPRTTAVVRASDTDDGCMPILAIVPLQLLSYHIARELKREIDQPRIFAKSVTME